MATLENDRIRKTRYQHKVCSLKSCERRGEKGCMHCTCDGSCKLGHRNGQCGDVREGSGLQCTHPNCPRDHRCTHSRRAVCYTCRRNRVTKAKKLRHQSEKNMILIRQRLMLWKHQESRLSRSVVDTRKQIRLLPGIHMLGSIAYHEEQGSLKKIWRDYTTATTARQY